MKDFYIYYNELIKKFLINVGGVKLYKQFKVPGVKKIKVGKSDVVEVVVWEM